MKRITYDSKSSISEAHKELINGGIIVYPTDTIYGFGCNAKNNLAIKKLNKIKRRIRPMSILAPNVQTASDWMDISSKHKKFARNIIRESNTVIVPGKKNVCSELIKGKNHSIGIRIPNHPFCKKLALVCSFPITTTSVNRTGEKPMTDPEIIASEFHNEINLIIEDKIIDGSASKIYLFQDGSWISMR